MLSNMFYRGPLLSPGGGGGGGASLAHETADDIKNRVGRLPRRADAFEVLGIDLSTATWERDAMTDRINDIWSNANAVLPPKAAALGFPARDPFDRALNRMRSARGEAIDYANAVSTLLDIQVSMGDTNPISALGLSRNADATRIQGRIAEVENALRVEDRRNPAFRALDKDPAGNALMWTIRGRLDDIMAEYPAAIRNRDTIQPKIDSYWASGAPKDMARQVGTALNYLFNHMDVSAREIQDPVADAKRGLEDARRDINRLKDFAVDPTQAKRVLDSLDGAIDLLTKMENGAAPFAEAMSAVKRIQAAKNLKGFMGTDWETVISQPDGAGKIAAIQAEYDKRKLEIQDLQNKLGDPALAEILGMNIAREAKGWVDGAKTALAGIEGDFSKFDINNYKALVGATVPPIPTPTPGPAARLPGGPGGPAGMGVVEGPPSIWSHVGRYVSKAVSLGVGIGATAALIQATRAVPALLHRWYPSSDFANWLIKADGFYNGGLKFWVASFVGYGLIKIATDMPGLGFEWRITDRLKGYLDGIRTNYENIDQVPELLKETIRWVGKLNRTSHIRSKDASGRVVDRGVNAIIDKIVDHWDFLVAQNDLDQERKERLRADLHQQIRADIEALPERNSRQWPVINWIWRPRPLYNTTVVTQALLNALYYSEKLSREKTDLPTHVRRSRAQEVITPLGQVISASEHWGAQLADVRHPYFQLARQLTGYVGTVGGLLGGIGYGVWRLGQIWY